MTRRKVSDELGTALEPWIPAPIPGGRGRRRSVSNRAALNGILHVLHTGIPWEDLPRVWRITRTAYLCSKARVVAGLQTPRFIYT
ncbi:MAG: transposase [Janthinobacterium lividum]